VAQNLKQLVKKISKDWWLTRGIFF
jgi:hypothetical protein